MLTSRGRFGEKWVVHVTKLVGPLVPVHGVAGFADPDGLLDVAGSLVGFCGKHFSFLPVNDVIVLN